MDKGLKKDMQHQPEEVKIQLDKERTYRLDLNAYFELDMLYEDKEKTYHHLEADLLNMRPYAVRAFLWAGLVHEDPELTLEEVGKHIDVHNISQYSQVIYKLILGDKMQQKQEEKETNVKKK
ncbi:hypothetical protein J5S49_13535 [Virgibacillus halodenitrificans]|uniref:hypothetical protein n=1 Tax=Virgibacillus halodenitrificans TaxID=1482 RepID=UPI001F277590|nr:hypothetical protein [Virgibacillus halodenitrificans]MCG1029314.1 hypothetical protein [Virgibacillus halodenitrificans]